MPEGIPFGRYRLLSLLGEGGMARVYRAVLSGPMGFEKEVALKRLDPRLTADERMVRSLINEARLGGQLRHKNIVEIYEFNQVERNYYLAMEYVDGWTLDTLLMKCRSAYEELPGSIVIEVMAGICQGLIFAHGLASRDGRPLNLVHRDLKPGNVIISRSGEVKILDFGIAKADTNLYKTTAADVTKGTPVYMSPEQVTGQNLDGRSDLFSLGSILHELVTLDVPFHGDNLLTIMHAVLNADITQAIANVEDRFPQLGPVLAKCMAKEPDDRYASASEIDRELRALRRQIAPGPTLAEWIEEVGLTFLPSEVANGDYGAQGPPRSLPDAAAISGSDLESLEADSWQWIHTTDMPGPSGTTSVRADTLRATGTSGPPPGALTADFFKTDGEGSRAPRGVAPTRMQRTIEAKTRKRKKRGNALLVGLSATALVLALVVAGALWVQQQSRAGTTRPVASVEPASPAPAPVPAPVAAPVVPEPEPGDPTAAAPAPATTPQPAAKPVAKPIAKPEPKPVVTPEVKPIAKPEPKPVVFTGTGKLNVNSKPWSNLYLDGRFIGQTPKIDFDVPAGRHTLEFHCGSCDPARKETQSFTLEDGGNFKKILRFDEE